MFTSEEQQNIEKVWKEKAISLGYTTVATLLNSLYPNEFECYMISFELCDSQGNSLDYFSFPIMPNQMSIQENLPTKVISTFGGVSAISSNIYTPKVISLDGNFGRNFKMLNRSFTVFSETEIERDYGTGTSKKEIELSRNLKTGYGCTKVLQSIINRSVATDDSGRCNRLYFYNMAFGESYLVKALEFNTKQDLQNNGMWTFNLKLNTICPLYLDKVGKKKQVATAFKNGLQAGMNNVGSGIWDTLKISGFDPVKSIYNIF